MTSVFTLAVLSLAQSTTSGAGKSNSSTANKRSFQRTQTIRHSRDWQGRLFCTSVSSGDSGGLQKNKHLEERRMPAEINSTSPVAICSKIIKNQHSCHLLLFESDSALSMSKLMSVWTEGQARSPLAARIRSICTTSPATLRLILLRKCSDCSVRKCTKVIGENILRVIIGHRTNRLGRVACTQRKT